MMEKELFLAKLERQLVWDMFPHDSIDETFVQLGMVPASEEVSDREHDDSDTRVRAVAPLLESIDQVAEVAGGIITKAMASARNLPPEVRESISETYTTVLQASTRGILSQLLDRQILTRKE